MKKVLLYGLDGENLAEIKNIFEERETRVHLLKNQELHEVLLNVLEKEESHELEAPEYPMTLCLFAGYTKDEIYEVIGTMTEKNLKKPVFATVTKNNIEWKIGRLLVDVNEEHIEMQKLMAEKNAPQ